MSYPRFGPLRFKLVLLASLLQSALAAAPLDFEEALGLALSSPGVRLAEMRVASAEHGLAVASSPVSASLSAGYGQTWGSLDAPTLAEPRSLSGGDWDPFTFTATFNVVPAGPRHDALRRARWAAARAAHDLRDARAAALAGVSRDYLSALRAGQREVLRALELGLAGASLAAAEARYEVGAASEAERLQAQIALSRAESERAGAGRASLQALAALSLALNTDVRAVAGEPPAGKTPEPTGLEAQLLRRSDVREARLAVLEAELNAEAAWRNTLPSGALSVAYTRTADAQRFQLGAGFDSRSLQPSLSASYDPDAASPSELPQTNAASVRLGLSLEVPLDPALPAAQAAAALAVRESELQLAQTLALARLDVEIKGHELSASEATVALSQRLLEQSRRVEADTRARLELGLVSPLDVQQAELTSAEAELNLAEGQDALLLARLQLALALALDPLEVF